MNTSLDNEFLLAARATTMSPAHNFLMMFTSSAGPLYSSEPDGPMKSMPQQERRGALRHIPKIFS
jgi:hypothetical protein